MLKARAPEAPPPRGGRAPPRNEAMDMVAAAAKSAARAAGSQLGRQIMRGLLGSLFGGRRR